MQTQTHMLVSAALFAQPGRPLRNMAALLGALAPDLSIFAMFGWGKARGVAEHTIWRDWYFSTAWQEVSAISNSWPLYVGLGVAAASLGGKLRADPGIRAVTGRTDQYLRLWCSAILVFAMAAIIHIACDFPLHVDDGHPAFWPFSGWIFRSPVSYWDHNHYGDIVALVEMALGLFIIALLWRRFQGAHTRICLGLLGAFYLLVPLYFRLT